MAMLTKVWTTVEGFSNADDCCTTVVARKNNGETEIAYFAYNSIKIIYVKGILDIVKTSDGNKVLDTAYRTAADDWEVVVTVKTENGIKTLIIDTDDEIVSDCEGVEVTGSCIYENDEFDELDEEVISHLGLL